MLRKGMTKKEAAMEWQRGFNAIPAEMIKELMETRPAEWHEVTVPTVGDKVYVKNYLKGHGGCYPIGTITEDYEDVDSYLILLDNGATIEAGGAELKPLREPVPLDNPFFYSFNRGIDDEWLETGDGLREMLKAYFRIFEHDQWGGVFLYTV